MNIKETDEVILDLIKETVSNSNILKDRFKKDILKDKNKQDKEINKEKKSLEVRIRNYDSQIDIITDSISKVIINNMLKKIDTKIYPKLIKGLKEEEVFNEPLIFTEFHNQPGGIPTYLGVKDFNEIQDFLNLKLEEYNESNTIMELVLFKDAVAHVCRIARIIAQPRGNALLIGVGGSGKQSLSRLSSFICGFSVYQITINQTYSMSDLKEDLQKMYTRAGVKDEGILFLFLFTAYFAR